MTIKLETANKNWVPYASEWPLPLANSIHSRQQQLRLSRDKFRQAKMPCPTKECPTPSGNNPRAMSPEILDEVNERLIEWLKQEATTFDDESSKDESSEDETSSDEEEPEKKSSRPFGSLALRFKKWFTGHHHQEK
ncbi:uncharacterized protein FFUJ_14377 [Fusarium fujikuroi IMI 58289]|uniref:Uncharacterized protein n=1 Tax=Gibberella fujikuroi (strain CBS 195.34 / IMI 58289 / NRRL A-6831) TaxID=1279085 RepID=S0E2R7_GIBF5|nr:uncharacterized protein FFUJ_14377 [Fusarium fujikuroi IMI 58289]CCT69134.1 uncharacterized protein FFUJ_14377 [Fusarium fujikuroi IMI 58289]SCO08129.1 uncharacterized protein FFM5_09277 [Fusarium fujikuroi]